MIIDWVKKIETVLSEGDNKAVLLEEMENELGDMLEAAWRFDTVIIKMGEGLRIEICPLYAHEEPNIKAYTKDFNIIHKYTDVQNQKNQAETDLLDAVKNNPDTLKLGYYSGIDIS